MSSDGVKRDAAARRYAVEQAIARAKDRRRVRRRAFDAAEDARVQDALERAHQRIDARDLPPLDAPDFLDRKLAQLCKRCRDHPNGHAPESS